MTLTREEGIFLGVLAVNLVLAVIYLLYGMLFASSGGADEDTEQRRARDSRETYALRFLVMLLCPVVGIVFFLGTQVLCIAVFRFRVNLEDITFSKERVDTQVKADEEQERNIIPVEEALAVNDKRSLRTAMLSIIRGDVGSSLASIALALDSEDSETAHYAASVLSDRLNEFRMDVQRMYARLQEEPEQTGCEEELLDYMDGLLKQSVFTPPEQKHYLKVMAEAAESLYGKDASRFTPKRYEGVCLRLMEGGEYELSRQWCLRLARQYPETLCAYTCRLKLYFSTKDREAFFQTLALLKGSDVVIDSETLELIRIFS